MENVHYFLLTDTKAHISFSLSLSILILHTDVQALFVKIRSRLIIVQVFKLLSNTSILLKARVNVFTSVVIFSVDEVTPELHEAFIGLLELLLLNSSKFIVVLLRDVRFNLAWS